MPVFWTRAAVLLHGWRAELAFEEGTEILVATIEARTHWATGGRDCRGLSGHHQLTLCI